MSAGLTAALATGHMKQILQDLKRGDIIVEHVPVPLVRPGYLLIRSGNSLISAGTERMLLEFGRANILDEARQQPEKKSLKY